MTLVPAAVAKGVVPAEMVEVGDGEREEEEIGVCSSLKDLGDSWRAGDTSLGLVDLGVDQQSVCVKSLGSEFVCGEGEERGTILIRWVGGSYVQRLREVGYRGSRRLYGRGLLHSREIPRRRGGCSSSCGRSF